MHSNRIPGEKFFRENRTMILTKDWALVAARAIASQWPTGSGGHGEPGYLTDEQRDNIAVNLRPIIEGAAEPILTLLRESRREHHNTLNKGWACGVFYKDDDIADGGGNWPCDCGADEWNQKIDDTLKQKS